MESMGPFLLMVVSGGVAVFLATRLYLLVTRRELQVQWVVYSRKDTPVWYWITFANAIIGMVMSASLALFLAYGFVIGLDDSAVDESPPVILVETLDR